MFDAPIPERRLRFISCVAAIAALSAFVAAAMGQRWLIAGLYACVSGFFMLTGYTAGRAFPAHMAAACTLAAGSLLFLAAHLLTR